MERVKHTWALADLGSRLESFAGKTTRPDQSCQV